MLMHFVYMFNYFSQQFTWHFKQINVQKVTDYDCDIHHDMHVEIQTQVTSTSTSVGTNYSEQDMSRIVVFLQIIGVLCFSLVVDQLLDGLKATPFVRHKEWLKYVWKWSVIATDTFDRSLQVEKTFRLLNKYLQ